MKACGWPCPACSQDRLAEITDWTDEHTLTLRCPRCEHAWRVTR